MEDAGALGAPLIIDAATQKRTFGHYTRVLVDIDFLVVFFMRPMLKGKVSLSRCCGVRMAPRLFLPLSDSWTLSCKVSLVTSGRKFEYGQR